MSVHSYVTSTRNVDKSKKVALEGALAKLEEHAPDGLRFINLHGEAEPRGGNRDRLVWSLSFTWSNDGGKCLVAQSCTLQQMMIATTAIATTFEQLKLRKA